MTVISKELKELQTRDHRLPSLFEARNNECPILRWKPSNDAQHSIDLGSTDDGIVERADKAPARGEAREYCRKRCMLTILAYDFYKIDRNTLRPCAVPC